FNRDGKADLALGFGIVTYTEYTEFTGEYGYEYFEGDGFSWYFPYNTADYYSSYPIYTTSYETDVSVAVSFLDGRADVSFGPETDVTTTSYSAITDYGLVGDYDTTSSLAVGDFDHDGSPDVGAFEYTGSLDVLRNTSPREELQMAVSPASTTAG